VTSASYGFTVTAKYHFKQKIITKSNDFDMSTMLYNAEDHAPAIAFCNHKPQTSQNGIMV